MASNWRESEKCGVVGMIGLRVNLAESERCQKALKHRGNGPAGAVVLSRNGEWTQHLTPTLDQLADFTELAGVVDKTPIGVVRHNRYATFGATEGNTQPLLLHLADFTLAFDHNGNIPANCIEQIKPKLSAFLNPDASDSVIMAQYLIEQRAKYPDWLATFTAELPHFLGAFSITCLTDDGNLYAMKDPFGIRPLCVGWKDDQWIVVSETVALDEIKAEYVREILPGEIVKFQPNGLYESVIYAVNVTTKKTIQEKRCLLEDIYFSRKKSFDGNQKIEVKRTELGRAAARCFQKKHLSVDWVVPILTSGLAMAVGAAEELRIPIYEAIGLNGEKRSFIQDTQEQRQATVYQKHVVFSEKYMTEIAGKSVLLCDDSLVRGTSLEGLLKKIDDLKTSKPSQIHILLGSEPVSDICEWGVDLPNKSELLANRVGGNNFAELEKNVAQFLGVASVTYLDRKSVESALHLAGEQMCYHCFGGPKPIDEQHPPQFRAKQLDKLRLQKVLFLASGKGSNVEVILEKMATAVILAKPLKILTNQPNAGVIEVATAHQIPYQLVPSFGRLKNSELRRQFELELLSAILAESAELPTVVVLAGWQVVLSDAFIKALTDKQIQIVNLHPALLSAQGEQTVVTSKGKIQVLRGTHAIEQAHSCDISELPVTGVTVHFVAVGGQVDTGQVILKEEVARRSGETLPELTARIHQSEHRIYSVALQQVLLMQTQESSQS